MPHFTNDSQNAVNSYPDDTYEEEGTTEEKPQQSNYKYTSNSDEYVQHQQHYQHHNQQQNYPLHLVPQQTHSNTNSYEMLPKHDKYGKYAAVYSS
jgi:hypothetical protein